MGREPRPTTTPRHRGEHGPPRDYQRLLLEIARQMGIPAGYSEESWLERLVGTGREFPTRDAMGRYMAKSRRYWWAVDAFWHYRDRMDGEPVTSRFVPPELDLTELDQNGHPIPPARRKFDADTVADWAYRHRRLGVSYAGLEQERDLVGGAGKTSARTIAQSVERNVLLWELAEQDLR